MLEEQYDLPDDWKWAKVADVITDAQPGFASGQKDVIGGIRHLRMNNIGADCRINLDSVRTVPRDLAQSRHILEPNDVLICHTNSVKLVGKTALFDLPDGPYAFSNHLTRLRVKAATADPIWLWQVLATLWRERYFETRCKQWVNQATIERQNILDAPIPLPPLDEQHRIVAKIEQLFAESRTAREALDGVPALIKRFRQAVLAKAFRGELTERDPASRDEPASVLLERIREERRVKSKGVKSKREVEPAPPDISGLPELPEGWEWASVEQIAQVRLGRQRSPSRSTGPNMRPYLRAANVTWDGLDLSDVKEMDFSPAEQKIYRLKVGDVLLNEASGSVSEVGKPAIWNDEIANCCFQNTLIRVRSDAPLPKYLRFHFLHDAMAARFSEVTKGIGINHLGANGLSKWIIGLPPLAEQRRIVAKIEALFAQADAIEAAVQVARQRAEKVDQAILARAFRGEL